MQRLRLKLEENKISENYTITTYMTYDEKNYVLEINYLDGTFLIERIFPNNMHGVGKIEEFKEEYSNEESIKEYIENSINRRK